MANKKGAKKVSSTVAKAKASDVIVKGVRPYDILCGRNKACFNNIGNRRFRITIGMNVKKYDALPNRTDRGKFIVELARTLREDVGYRFFRVSKQNGKIQVSKVEMTDDEIRAKIGHALRDLSITQTNAAVEAAAKSVAIQCYEDTETDAETKSQATPSPPPKKVITTPPPKVVTPPNPLPRRVTNDFETNSKGEFVGLPQYPDILNMDTSMHPEEVPKEISFETEENIFTIPEEESQSPTTSSKIESDSDEPVPIEDCSSESSVLKGKDLGYGDMDFDMIPLRFDESDEPEKCNRLDPIPLEMLPTFVTDSLSSSSSEFEVDTDDMTVELSSNPEEIVKKIREMKGFPMFQEQTQDLLSLSDDHHMISSGDSVGCLSLDMAIHA